MATLRWWWVACAASGFLLVPSARAAEPRGTELVPSRWAFWTTAGMHWSGSVGTLQPATSPQPGLGLAALLRSPSGAWGFRGQLEASRYNTSYGDIPGSRFGGAGPFGSFPIQDESDLVWAQAGPQWGSASWPGKPYVYALAGAATLHTRLVPDGAPVLDFGSALDADATKFAAAIGAGLRWPLGSAHRFELTTEADYRGTAPIDHVTAPVADSTGNHLQWTHGPIEMLTLRLALSARWGGD